MHLFCLNGAILNNDAEVCYDRMIPKVTTLHLKSLGLPNTATKCSIDIKYKIQRHIKTANGISKDSYSHSEEFGNYGEGQGKVSSPSNWQFQSSTLLAALTRLCIGAGLYLSSTCKNFVASRIGKAYVDDANNPAIDQHTQCTDTQISITKKITKIAQTWEQLLFGSEGKLSMKKSRWYMLWWVWENGKLHLASKEEAPAEVLISEGRATAKIILPQIEPDVSLRQLGALTNLLKK
eukprot:4486097-Ditylum_brightwellii.AAC.1